MFEPSSTRTSRRPRGFWAALAMLACGLSIALMPIRAGADVDEPWPDRETIDPILEADAMALAEATLFALATDIRRTWDVKCNVAAFDIYDSETAHGIKLTVTNSGDCPFKITVTKADGTTEDFTIPTGTPRTINRSNIKKIAVDCDGAAANDCKASYTLTES